MSPTLLETCILDKRLEDEGFRLMADSSLDVLCRVTLVEMRCTYCSPSALRVLGWTPEEMLHRFPEDLIHPEEVAAVQQAHARYVGNETNSVPDSMRLRKKDGSYALLEVHACIMHDPVSKAPWQVLLNMRDVSVHRSRQVQLEALAATDPLTGLGNRRTFDSALDQEWRRALREQSPLSLLMIDVDAFKGINDTYGHPAGDDYLRVIAETISSSVRRPADMVSRYGGEEFALILPATGAAGAAEVAEQLRLAICELRLPHVLNPDHESVVTVSIGAATAMMRSGLESATSANLLRAADSALYKAKQGGRNRVETSVLLRAGKNGGARPLSRR